MNQVGDNKVFSVAPVPVTGTQVYSYVWNWWDDTSSATVEPWTTKRINIGGNPVNGELHFTCTPVQIDGQSTVMSGTITANNPPTLVPPVIITANDGYFPYNTQIKVTAFDLDGDSFTFAWYSDTTYLGAGVSTSVGNVNGTWHGNGTTIVDSFAATQNVLSTTIPAARPISLFVIDSNSGTTSVDFDMRGSIKPPPTAGISAASDASGVPVQRIGAGNTVNFEVYARDALNGAVSFSWAFNGTNNWTTTVYTNGTSEATADGGFKNHYVKDVSTEIISSGTDKIATAFVRVTTAGGFVDLPFSVKLVKNTPPSGITFTAKLNGNAYSLADLSSIATTDTVEFDAVAEDRDDDIISYYWVFTQPAGVVPTTLRIWGPKVVISAAGYSGQFIQAQVTAIDQFGGSITVGTPAIPVT